MIKIFPNFEDLTVFAAEKFVALAKAATKKRKRFTVALSGGSTPKALYELLASERYAKKIEWKQVYFFFGDERNVLPDEDESNFLMANTALFLPLNISSDKIYRWHTEIEPPEHIAADYAEHIESLFEGFPVFDLILLGMGDDGHTASLFPYTDALKENEKIACANPVEKLDTTRLTLTFPVINRAANVVFLIKGADKKEVLKTVLEGDFQPDKYPSQNVKPENGELWWLIDEAAAGSLTI